MIGPGKRRWNWRPGCASCLVQLDPRGTFMCGIVGIVGKSNVNVSLYDALTMLQHRGQDAAGIMTCHNGKMAQQKAVGLVRDVFRTRHMQRLLGNMGIGHVRYPTAGSSGPAL